MNILICIFQPVVLILCGSIERVEKVFRTCEQLTEPIKSINVVCLYGGIEALQEVSRIRGEQEVCNTFSISHSFLHLLLILLLS